MTSTAQLQYPSLFLIATLAFATAGAHTIPSLTVEAEFKADGAYELRANVDPRLFLSTTPSELPPVPVEWYRGQSERELAETRARATEYLSRALEFLFDEKAVPPAGYDFLPMDGATNMPLDAESKEIHLLARFQSQVPEGGGGFQVRLGKDALVSMILLNSQEGHPDRKPQVLFPGETSRPFQVVPLAGRTKEAKGALPMAMEEAKSESQKPDFTMPVWARIGIALCIIASLVMQFARRKG